MILDFDKCFTENKKPWSSNDWEWEDGATQERIEVWPRWNLNWDLKAEKNQKEYFNHRDNKCKDYKAQISFKQLQGNACAAVSKEESGSRGGQRQKSC